MYVLDALLRQCKSDLSHPLLEYSHPAAYEVLEYFFYCDLSFSLYLSIYLSISVSPLFLSLYHSMT